MKMKHFLTGILLGMLIFTGSAYASFSSIVAYGDSLTDNGDGLALNTDGPVWVEFLQSTYGAALYDYAVSGATTSEVIDQIANSGISSTTSFIDGALFTVWAGANDITQAVYSGAYTGQVVLDAVDNIEAILTSLIDTIGADSLLVLNLPDLGKTPLTINTAYSSYLSGITAYFNDTLASMVNDLIAGYETAGKDVDIYYLDIDALFKETLFDDDGIPDSTWDMFFWSDGYHPSYAGHALVAKAAEKMLPTPVPGSILLLATGLVSIAGFRRKQAA